VDSTRIVGEAIARASRPPRVWLQASAATIFAHGYETSHGESSGRIGGDEVGVPSYWARMVDVAEQWERALADAETKATRKVALRTSIVMSPGRGGAFDVLLGLVRSGLGGRAARVPEVRAASAEVRGGYDKELVRRVVRRHINEIRFCYERELQTRPDLHGRVLAEFVIGASGDVLAASASPQTLPSEPVASCIASAIRRWQFVAPGAAGAVQVTYPFVLQSTE